MHVDAVRMRHHHPTLSGTGGCSDVHNRIEAVGPHARGRFAAGAAGSESVTGSSCCSCPASSSSSSRLARSTSLMAAASTVQLSWVSAAMQSLPSIGM